MDIRPLNDRIVVKCIEAQRRSRRKERLLRCREAKRLEDGSLGPLEVRVGDHILYGKYTASEVRLAGEDYLIVREDEVLGVLESSEKPQAKLA